MISAPHAPLPRRAPALVLLLACLALLPSVGRAQADNPYGDCCVSNVTMSGVTTWQVTCGTCATNPGTFTISQPDPEKLVFTGPGGVSANSRYEAAQAICQCPSEKARREREASMRRFGGK